MNNTEELQVNKKHKDRLFRLLFGNESNKENLLSLYNAINNTAYHCMNTRAVIIQTCQYVDLCILESYTVNNIKFNCISLKNPINTIEIGIYKWYNNNR